MPRKAGTNVFRDGVRDVDVSDLLEQSLDDGCVTLCRCRLQSIAVPSALRINISALLEEPLDDSCVASC